MSIVGNRPLPLYEAEQLTSDLWSLRFMAPAGITGLWQVRRNEKKNMTAEERKLLDNQYAKDHSFFKDTCLIFKRYLHFGKKTACDKASPLSVLSDRDLPAISGSDRSLIVRWRPRSDSIAQDISILVGCCMIEELLPHCRNSWIQPLLTLRNKKLSL